MSPEDLDGVKLAIFNRQVNRCLLIVNFLHVRICIIGQKHLQGVILAQLGGIVQSCTALGICFVHLSLIL